MRFSNVVGKAFQSVFTWTSWATWPWYTSSELPVFPASFSSKHAHVLAMADRLIFVQLPTIAHLSRRLLLCFPVYHCWPKFTLLKLVKFDWWVQILAIVRSQMIGRVAQWSQKPVSIDVSPNVIRNDSAFLHQKVNLTGLALIHHT